MPNNAYMYVTPLRVVDVWGQRLYVSREHYDNPDKPLLPICRKDGLRRSFTKAGERDRQNMLHRANISKVLKGNPHV